MNIPEFWSIKITEENVDDCLKYRDVKCSKKSLLDSRGWILSYYNSWKGYNVFRNDRLPSKFIEIDHIKLKYILYGNIKNRIKKIKI